jgi:hypothetical protein
MPNRLTTGPPSKPANETDITGHQASGTGCNRHRTRPLIRSRRPAATLNPFLERTNMIWLILVVGVPATLAVTADDLIAKGWHYALYRKDEWKRHRKRRRLRPPRK